MSTVAPAASGGKPRIPVHATPEQVETSHRLVEDYVMRKIGDTLGGLTAAARDQLRDARNAIFELQDSEIHQSQIGATLDAALGSLGRTRMLLQQAASYLVLIERKLAE